MLRRIFVNNYKCLLDFELKFDELTLLLGDNGSGKSAIFEVVKMLRDFIGSDSPINRLFLTKDVTGWGTDPAWDDPRSSTSNWLNVPIQYSIQGEEDDENKSKSVQFFELEFCDANETTFAYQLVIWHDRNQKLVRVASEILTCNGRPLFEFQIGEAQLYNDRHEKGPQLNMDITHSGLAYVGEVAR